MDLWWNARLEMILDKMDTYKPNRTINKKQHWDDIYANSPQEKLGWFENDLSPTIQLLSKTGLDTTARTLIIGAGSTTLVDELIKQEYSNIIATDISKVALDNLQQRVNNLSIEYIIDDLTKPSKLSSIEPIDLWIDRAVLHFFTEENERTTYFNLLKRKVKEGGFVLLAQFSLNGASKCSGLPLYRYSKEMLQSSLGDRFSLIDSFDYIYTMPSGDIRPYIYTLFKYKSRLY
ncbi:hypothetical protein MNBD_BACTEROID06-887 [hydrothermal vent metagenome]|uniref:Methyltransferase domain-containing protein n=1 Tax=hydrothermal vent metagenome TaxID=652676 RepID=A0A3B0U6J7_9ZZZZ